MTGYSLDPNSPNQQTFYMEGECYDYDADIDELFVLAGKIICPAGQEEVCFTFKAPIVLLKFRRIYNYDMLTVYIVFVACNSIQVFLVWLQ